MKQTEKLLFTSDAFYNGALKYEKGKTYDVEVATGEVQRWLIRGVAKLAVAVNIPVQAEPVVEQEEVNSDKQEAPEQTEIVKDEAVEIEPTKPKSKSKKK